ncbi:MAG: formimidoylglutamase [Chitinophagaceae bacterium]
MLNTSQLADFLTPVNVFMISDDEGYLPGQLGQVLTETAAADAQIVLIGCNEFRGAGISAPVHSADSIRKQLYQLYYWHGDIRLADIGDIKTGATLADTGAALKTVCRELMEAGKKVIVIGGSHDNTLAQYYAFADRKQIIEATVVDALLDLRQDTTMRSQNFLLEMLLSQPNFVRHYNHIAFQSYFVNPLLLETIDKLRFDCFRVGKVKEQIEEMEPVIRSSHLMSFDMNAIANTYAPAGNLSPNGLSGVEACKLMQYAGMSAAVETVGIYGFDPSRDKEGLTGMQIAHMLWYYFDGYQKQQHEADIDDRNNFNEYNTVCAEVDTLFLQSKRTGRWWMQLPDKSFTACSYTDYLTASHNDLPERWLRAQERM